MMYNHTPDIAYFPTFVFQFPNNIFLTEGIDNRVNKFYRQMFQDILDYEGSGHTIETSIVRRVRQEKYSTPWPEFFSKWRENEDQRKITHVMDRASSIVTQIVFGSWNKIFGEDAKGKEVIIDHDVTEGKQKDDEGRVVTTEHHDVFIKFEIKDGTRRFKVKDRSLGFRWFFAFMLFTQFRVARENARPVLFLFDEPASNLHAAAQQRLIESFPEIAKGDATLAYSTHSHYLIEPRWLEQTFIVTNRADAPSDSIIQTLSYDDETLDIKAHKYRAFVNEFPNNTSYFQPILDRLEVVPSRFDIGKSSIILEGKSDYYILRYAAKLLKLSEPNFVPGLGAGTFSSLIGLHIGWGIKSIFVLDADKQGSEEKERYLEQFALSGDRLTTLSEFLPSARKIEDIFDEAAKQKIKKVLDLTKNPSKKQVLRFIQERLASDKVVPLGPGFKKSASKFILSQNSRILRFDTFAKSQLRQEYRPFSFVRFSGLHTARNQFDDCPPGPIC